MTHQIEMIKRLREETGAGVLECRTAWEQSGMLFAPALALLREKAAAEAARRVDHPASQGRIEVYSHGNGRIGVMVEINCETDFAAHSQAFRSFAHEIALQVAAAAPRFIRDEEVPAEFLEKETQKAVDRARAEGKPESVIPRIISGMIGKTLDQQVLLRQPYIRDETRCIAKLLNQAAASVGERIVIRRFMRWELDKS